MPVINGVSSIDNTNAQVGTAKKNADEVNDFSSYMEQTKSLDDIFEQAAEKYNIPVELLKSVAKAESDFNPNAVSRCGAQGIMQLMPGTAKELGVADAFDPEQNIMGGAKYLSGLLKKYDGDIPLTLAAYNAGSGNVAKYGGIPPFTETQNYVKKIMGYLGEQIETASKYDSQIASVPGKAAASVPTPIQRNLAFLLTKDGAAPQGGLDDLQTLFSYEDYLKFLELFINNQKEDDEKDKNTGTASGEINYNLPVLNLLKNQNQIS